MSNTRDIGERKRLLLLSPQSVAPVRHGAAIRIFHLARRMARDFDVTLLVPAGAAAARAAAAEWGFPLEVFAAEDRTCGFAARVRGRLDRRRSRDDPFGRVYGPLHRWDRLLREALEARQPHAAVLAHTWHVATFGRLGRRRPRACVVDAHNVESVNLERFAATLPDSGRLDRHRERVRRIESSLARWVDAFWACSAPDVETLRRWNPAVPGLVVPNGVDTRRFAFEEARPDGAPELVFVGALGYEPAEHGLLEFHRDVWPRVLRAAPGARLTLVGQGPTARLRALAASDPAVSLEADVPDVRPYLRRAAVSVCPLRVGSGTRLKILEAMSAGRPVVSTTVGAEGIEARPGAEIRIADDAEGFARATVGLLRDAEAWEAQRRRARALVEARYDWDAIGDGAARWLAEDGWRTRS